MCVNDLLVQEQSHVVFELYIYKQNKFKKIKNIVRGIIKGCEISNCKLVGGDCKYRYIYKR